MDDALITKPAHPVSSIIELIGNTPILELARISPKDGATIFGKLEFMNPGFSVKDRVALGMIRDAEEKGVLEQGGTIIEPTAGNTGIGLALVGRQLGYEVILVVPDNYSIEKQKLMRALGGTVVNTPEDDAMQGAIDKAYELAAETPGSYVPQQFENRSNTDTHYRTTAVELWKQMEGKIDAFVAGSGTGGTFAGIARYLKEKDPRIHTIVVEPEGSILGGGEPGPHDVEGIGSSSFIPGALDLELADEIVMVHDDPAFEMVSRLALEEGLLCGSSSGAAVRAALDLAARMEPGTHVVTVIPDSSERYLSKGIYSRQSGEED